MTAAAPGQVRLLTRSQIRALLRWPELIDATERALTTASQDSTTTAALSGQLVVPGAALHLKSGALLSPPILSVKANLRPAAGNSAGVVLAFDPAGFTLRAILDSADITAMRTAAVAAVAGRRLTPASASGGINVAVVGAGPVGRQSLAAVRQVVSVTEARVWSRDRGRAHELAAGAGVLTSVCGSAAEAAEGAQLIITATPARETVLPASAIAAGAVVLALGADTAGKRELGDGALRDAAIVIDVPEAFGVGECAWLPGDAADHAHVVLGALLAGQASLPADRHHVVFDSVGSPVVDAAATELVVALAEREDTGELFAFAG